MAEDVETNAFIHFVDERDLLTTELSDYNDVLKPVSWKERVM